MSRAVPASHFNVRDKVVRCETCHAFVTFPTDEWGRLYQECACGVQPIARHAPPAAECDPVLAVVPPAVALRPQRRPKPSEAMRRVIGWAGSNRREEAGS